MTKNETATAPTAAELGDYHDMLRREGLTIHMHRGQGPGEPTDRRLALLYARNRSLIAELVREERIAGRSFDFGTRDVLMWRLGAAEAVERDIRQLVHGFYVRRTPLSRIERGIACLAEAIPRISTLLLLEGLHEGTDHGSIFNNFTRPAEKGETAS